MERTLATSILLSLVLLAPAAAQPEPETPEGGRWRNGNTQLLRHHLLGEELRAPSGPDVPAAPRVDQTPVGPGVEPPPAGTPPASPDQALADALQTRTAQDILGGYMSDRVPVAFDQLSEADQARFADLLQAHADNPDAQAYLLRGLASSNTVDDLAWLSSQIEGKDATWLRNNATLTGDQPLTQQFSASCVPTVGQALRGELDPVYALRHRQAGDLHSYDGMDPEAYNPGVAEEQRTALVDGGGVPVARDEPNGAGLMIEPFQEVMNQGGQPAGLSYEAVATPNGEDAAAILDANLARGVPTPLRIASQYGGHAVLALDSRQDGSGLTEYQIYDPWFGKLTWVPRDSVVNDTVDVGTNQPHVTHAFRTE